jgi:hypothetical protein
MQSLFDDPMVQTGFAPLLVALLVGGALLRTRFAWFAVAAAFATAVGLSTGIGFTPLTASRKVLLLVLLAPFVGLVLDLLPRPPRLAAPALAALCGLASVWVFWSVLSQREAAQALALAAGVAVFVTLLVGLTLRLRGDGVAGGAATVALGLAVGVAALLSASIGNLANGVAVAAGGGAMLLLQFALGRAVAPGFIGTLTTGLGAALFTAATFVLAQLPWYAMPLLLLVPLAANLDFVPERSPRVRLVVTAAVTLAVASATVLAAWLATRGAAA